MPFFDVRDPPVLGEFYVKNGIYAIHFPQALFFHYSRIAGLLGFWQASQSSLTRNSIFSTFRETLVKFSTL